MTDPITRLAEAFDFPQTDAASFWYDRMASQSGERLPLVYQPLEVGRRGHVVDRGQILDFARVGPWGRVLDVGPGDGWPSLPMAGLVGEVVGVDASARRVAVCRANARRLGVANATFAHVPAGEPLPWPTASFDGVTAESAIEQTPDVPATLRELARVLKAGGRLRLSYEALERYRHGPRRHLALGADDERPARLLVFDRHVDAGLVDHYALHVDLTGEGLRGLLRPDGGRPGVADLTCEAVDRLAGRCVASGRWALRHPTCDQWVAMLREAGFGEVRATDNGGRAAGAVFDSAAGGIGARDLGELDAALAPAVGAALSRDVAGDPEAWIAARR